MISAVMHGAGQVLVIAWMYENVLMLNYLVIMIASGLVTGLLVAWLAKTVILRLRIFKIESSNYEIN